MEKFAEQERKDFEFFLNDIKDNYVFNMEDALEYLIEEKSGYYSITTQGIDFSYDSLEKELLKADIIFYPENNITMQLINEGVPAELAKYYQVCYNNGTMQENLMPERILSIIKNVKA